MKTMNVAYWLGLTLWVSALIAGAIAASVTFSTLPDLAVTLQGYAVDARVNHGNLAAGIAMEKVFFICDVMQYAMAVIVLIALVAQIFCRVSRGRPFANLGRAVCIMAAAGTLGYHAFAVAPDMNGELHHYWKELETERDGEARTPDVDAAIGHLERFNEGHHVAEPLMTVRLVLLLVAVGCSAVAFSPPSTKRAAADTEEPALLNRKS